MEMMIPIVMGIRKINLRKWCLGTDKNFDIYNNKFWTHVMDDFLFWKPSILYG